LTSFVALGTRPGGKHPEKWRTYSCSNTPVGFGHGFLSKEQRDNAGAFLPTLLTWLHLIFTCFFRLKSALKGWRFYGVIDIIKKATKDLKRLSQNDFQACFQYLYSRWQKCIVAQGDYFEGTVAEMVVLFCIFRK
jgi:hypothetical protein